ncbi:TetR/AcrR family transcriptional regulator [Streptoalloteichus hindustanus]|uniref:Transcriptional regulator, TetR family n=1 Tax=Streptoalloteichus hindustanus TaxID=2017 RepID=A0A1M5CH34_STRHI|nr:TetR/AcrR family transcriptional regulator [Streptoalloteichus hindustanus]SHF54016.1 transcriptional regulator, TetR family [Streptoalloteichus hindustanus]
MAGGDRTPAGQRVWDTARELFYREGVRSCGVAEIAERSGVGKPSIYRNFGSKDELAVAYLREKAVSPKEILADARAAFPDDGRAQLRHVLAQVATAITDPGHRGCPLANAVVEFPDRAHPVREAAEELKREYLDLFTELVSSLPVEHPENLAYLIQMLVEGAHITGQIFSPDWSAASLVDAADRLVDSYLRK